MWYTGVRREHDAVRSTGVFWAFPSYNFVHQDGWMLCGQWVLLHLSIPRNFIILDVVENPKLAMEL